MPKDILEIIGEESTEEDYMNEFYSYINDFQTYRKKDFKDEVIEYILYLRYISEDKKSAKEYSKMLEKLATLEKNEKNILYLYDFYKGEFLYLTTKHKVFFIKGNDNIN